MQGFYGSGMLFIRLFIVRNTLKLKRELQLRGIVVGTVIAASLLPVLGLTGAEVDLILHHGKIVSVDRPFSIHQALAISGSHVTALGSDDDILKLKSPHTRLIDLEGRTVLPGLIDSHVHPGAAMTEFDHELPDMNEIGEVLAYVRARSQVVPEGKWIVLQQIFITRLREKRYPTRAELDSAAPHHPVIFRTGPDASLNSLALKAAGIDRDFKVPAGVPGRVERDAQGEPTGVLRGYEHFTQLSLSSGKKPTEDDHYARTLRLFKDYNSVGLTTVGDRSANPQTLARYEKMKAQGDLTVRLACSYSIPTVGPMEAIEKAVSNLAVHPLRKPDPMLRIIGTKIWLDGGMLTGSAYMREPWGTSSIYGISDPEYRGVLNLPKDRLLPIVRAVAEAGMQFTAHSVGDGAVHALLEVYEEVDRTTPIRPTRSGFTHSNFMSREAVERAARIGAVHDMQPIWLYLDARTLQDQFGYERLRWFQPLRSIFEAGGMAGGGSDHMMKIGSFRAINPYNPFLGMWVAITRQARGYEGQLHPEEVLSREQAIRFYTINNAYLLFLEDQVGSLQPGKRADLIVLDTDLLTCPANKIKDIQVLQTWLDGKRVW